MNFRSPILLNAMALCQTSITISNEVHELIDTYVQLPVNDYIRDKIKLTILSKMIKSINPVKMKQIELSWKEYHDQN